MYILYTFAGLQITLRLDNLVLYEEENVGTLVLQKETVVERKN